MLFILFLSTFAAIVVFYTYVEYKYYLAVKELEPDIWIKLGSPNYVKFKKAFSSADNIKLIECCTNPKVIKYVKIHRLGFLLVLAFPLVMLSIGIIYFKYF